MTAERKGITNRHTELLRKTAVLTGLLLTFLFSGCAFMMAPATSGLMNHLSRTILDNNDLDLVEAGAPAYLLLIDSLIAKDPDNADTLSTASLLYAAYADLFVEHAGRSRKISEKSMSYALRAICIKAPRACDIKTMPYEQFDQTISQMEKAQMPFLFTLGNAWASWIMANRNDFNAIAEMARIERIMLRVAELDPAYRDGAAHLYLGTMATLLPPALGGKPEEGKAHFETALKISKGKNLMVKVTYARMYARMMFDRELHDRLLKEVLAADPEVPGYTLINTHARSQAARLLADADDYF